MEIINKLDCFLCIWLSKISCIPCLKRAARKFSGLRYTENRRDFLAPLGLVAPVGPLHCGWKRECSLLIPLRAGIAKTQTISLDGSCICYRSSELTPVPGQMQGIHTALENKNILGKGINAVLPALCSSARWGQWQSRFWSWACWQSGWSRLECGSSMWSFSLTKAAWNQGFQSILYF